MVSLKKILVAVDLGKDSIYLMKYAIDMAQKANVKKVVLFHHDPLRTDQELTDLEKVHRSKLDEGSRLGIEFAREGMTIEV